MPKDRRLFMTFPIDFWTHPKVSRLSDAAFRAFVESNGHSRMQESDGVIEREDAEFLWDASALQELCKSHPTRPLMFFESDEYVLRDYAQHQMTKSDRDELTEKRRKAAETRWNNASAKQVQSKPVQADAEYRGKSIEKHSSATAVHDADFERAWSHWPKKTERKKSLEKFKSVARKRGVDVLTADIRKFGEAYARTTDRQYVPALNVWLNGERWTDELPGGAVTQVTPKRRFKAHDD